MLNISDTVVAAFHEDGLKALRAQILERWFANLRSAGEAAGDAGREQVLAEIAQISRDDPDLTVADLLMLADLRLVEVARQARAARAPRR